MIKNPKLGKHTHNNRESKIGLVLRLVREAKRYSMQDIAKKLDLKVADIDHLENGRKFYTEADVEKFLECLELKKTDYQALLDMKVITKSIVNHFLIREE